MTDEEMEALRQTMLALGVAVPSDRAEAEVDRWLSSVGDRWEDMVRICSCRYEDDCPNLIACKTYPEHHKQGMEKHFKRTKV